jgi:hypothetical protein
MGSGLLAVVWGAGAQNGNRASALSSGGWTRPLLLWIGNFFTGPSSVELPQKPLLSASEAVSAVSRDCKLNEAAWQCGMMMSVFAALLTTSHPLFVDSLNGSILAPKLGQA